MWWCCGCYCVDVLFVGFYCVCFVVCFLILVVFIRKFIKSN